MKKEENKNLQKKKEQRKKEEKYPEMERNKRLLLAKSVVFLIIVRAMHPTQAAVKAGSKVIVTIFFIFIGKVIEINV